MARGIRQRLSGLLRGTVGFESFFNVPMRFEAGRLRAVNERIVEQAFVVSELGLPGDPPARILDFGCARSWMALTLASLGFRVVGVDLRDYPFSHPNLEVRRANIIDFADETFDVVVSLSTIEHVGLGVYDRRVQNDDLHQVLRKVHELLVPTGRFVVTLPVGRPSVDEFERSFSPGQLRETMAEAGFAPLRSRYFRRVHGLHWIPASEAEVAEVANDLEARRGPGSGVNGVGCFVFTKR